MRICRYTTSPGHSAYGVVEDNNVHRLEGDIFDTKRPTTGAVIGPLESIQLLAPVEPSKVVCTGRNYHSLLAEQGRQVPAEPFLFLKASTAVVGPHAPVYYPRGVQDVAHEGELAVVIGRETRQVHREYALEQVLGYTVANDITVRDWQDPSAQWWRAKSSDTHCPLGPWIQTDVTDPHNVRVRTYVNDELRQNGSTSDMVFDIPTLIEHVSAHMTLLPGDVLLTGTAAGIRPVQPGDRMRVEAEGIGSIDNPVEPWPLPTA